MDIFSRVMVVVAAALLLGGCVPMVAGSGLVATDMVAERRGPESFVEDNWIAWKIRSSYVKSETVQVGNVNVTVYKGKVLLTGTASSKEEIRQAIAIAKKTEGVVDVASELVVQHVTAGEIAEDVWITNQVKIRILADQLVRGLDIHVETTKGVVFLTGMAKTVSERDRAIGIAQNVSGVREVVSYIEIQSKAYPLAEHKVERKAGDMTGK
ncbi:MAG: BON domain-containing protein [Magnetococcales bacterium]|nr:BON domain-containing protein [Magnetococcales bacterium]MBF0421053.1 BON domain-containing protein [Magnetococcales bacterium]MBF0435590.1 BON domain-containing protein [Magnetococcales bacterium]